MRGPSDKYMENFNLLAADKGFSPFAVENAENFVYNPTDFSASPLAQIVRTNNNFLSHGYVRGLNDMALREETKCLVLMLIFYHDAQWDLAQLRSFKILFQLDPNITNADMMTSLLSHQILREALYAEDLSHAAEILRNESSHLHFHQIEQVFEEVGSRGPVTSWVFLLKHILSPDFQKSNSHPTTTLYLGREADIEVDHRIHSFRHAQEHLRTAEQLLCTLQSGHRRCLVDVCSRTPL
ncbi:hypothetical protein BJ741DRAFT_293752 [Chytriomyces cf. hyalinus JEL632]|nr:hypothetical protein BJ741DRAFT_293752 [Chytriomyces cf. hyalinus JEL632]